jgi:hypothetical protein
MAKVLFSRIHEQTDRADSRRQSDHGIGCSGNVVSSEPRCGQLSPSARSIATKGNGGFEDVITPLLRSAPVREFLPVTVSR